MQRPETFRLSDGTTVRIPPEWDDEKADDTLRQMEAEVVGKPKGAALPEPPTFGSRVGTSIKESLIGTEGLPAHLIKAAMGDQSARDYLTAIGTQLDPRNTTAPPSVMNPLKVATQLAGANTDNIEADFKAGNYGALAGDVAIPIAGLFAPKVPVLRMAKGTARGVGSTLETVSPGIREIGHYGIIGGAFSGDMEKMGAGVAARIAAPFVRKAGTALRTWGESGGARPDLIPPTAPPMMTPPVAPTFFINVPDGRTGAVRMPMPAAARSADWAPPVREAAPAPEPPTPVAPPPAPPTEAELVAQRLAKIRASGGLPAGNADILPEMQARYEALRLGRTPIATTVEQSQSPTPAGGLHIDPAVARAEPQVSMRDNRGPAATNSAFGLSPNDSAWWREHSPETMDAWHASGEPDPLKYLATHHPDVAKAFNVARGERAADTYEYKRREAADRRNSQE